MTDKVIVPINDVFDLADDNYGTNDIASIASSLRNTCFFFPSHMKRFLTIEDVMEITGYSKTTVLKLFNMKEFPACDFGKGKIVSEEAFWNFFSERRVKADYAYWRN